MIVDPDARIALSSLGWVDGGALWALDHEAEVPRHIELSDARYLSVVPSADGSRFGVEHHRSGRRWAVTAHEFRRPELVLAEVLVDGWTVERRGDMAAFVGLPLVYVTYLDNDATGAAGYYLIDLSGRVDEVRRLDWFNGDRYDLAYQSVVSVTEIPASGYLFSVQRSSDLVLCDPDNLEVSRLVPLADRLGTAQVVVRRGGDTLIAVDYDTVVTVDTADWGVTARWEGQPPAANGHRMFLGEIWARGSDDEVLIARPGSADVVALDPDTLSVRATWPTGRQPLQAALLGERLVARDWKSGDLITA